MLQNIRLVLVNPSHPGNIGASARAMKNMGLSELYLVDPKEFPSEEANIRASGATDILENATVVKELGEALEGCDLIYGASARHRTLEKPVLTPNECAKVILSQPNYKVAILFGRERAGLSNDELSLCHSHIVIPTVDEFSSLNLAAEVQVISSELRCAYIDHNDSNMSQDNARELAPADQVLGFYQHLEQTLVEIGFLDPKQPKMLMQRLQRLFNRCLLDTKEINILRGILSNIEKKLNEK